VAVAIFGSAVVILAGAACAVATDGACLAPAAELLGQGALVFSQDAGDVTRIVSEFAPAEAGEGGALARATRMASALRDDPYHRATTWVVDDLAAEQFQITGGDGVHRTLFQLPGELNGKPGIFEWIVDNSSGEAVITHQRFIDGGSVMGAPNQRP
jgi:hypothetical protein